MNWIFILPVITLLLFFINLLYKGNSVESNLLFILTFLPLMDLKISNEAWGGFKTFDFICFSCVVLLFKDFTTINLKKKNRLFFPLFILLCIVIVLSGLFSQFPDRTFLNLFKIFPIFIFSRFFVTECVIDPSFHYRVIKALKVSYITAIVFLCLQMIIGLKFTFYQNLNPNTFDPNSSVIRYPGIFYDAQANGQFLAMGSFLFLYIEKGASRIIRILNYLAFILIVGGIVIAGSRAAFGGFTIGLIIVIFMAAKKYRLYVWILTILGLLVYTFAIPRAGVFNRSTSISEDYMFRQSIWKEAFEISKQHPYLGIGSGNYQSYIMRYSQNQYLEFEDGKLLYFDQPENGYLKIMVELGFIGFGVFVLFLLIPLLKGFKLRFKNIVDNRITFLLASLISWLIAFNTVYSIYDYRLLIMVASLIVLIVTYPPKEQVDYDVDVEQDV